MHVLVLWLMTFQEVTKPKQQSATITYGEDREIKLLVQGRSGNLVLRPAESTEGLAEVVFQQGSGYVSYDRQEQLLTWVSHKKRSLNHTSRAVERCSRRTVPRSLRGTLLQAIAGSVEAVAARPVYRSVAARGFESRRRASPR